MSPPRATARKPQLLVLAAGLAVAAGLIWLMAGQQTPAPIPQDPPALAVETAPNAATPSPPVRAEPAPAAATCSFVVVDAGTQTPLAGAALHRLDDGALVATADAAGRCSVAAGADVTLVAFAPGYLLRLCPASTAGELPLRRDAMSRQVRFRFRGVDPAAIVPVRIRQLEALPLTAGLGAAELRAFTEHDMLAALPQLAFAGVLSSRDGVSDRQLATDGALRAGCAGRFQIEVATAAGLAARAQFTIDPATATGVVVDIELANGTFACGTVRRDGQPLDGVQVTSRDGDPLHAVATTDAAGRFRLGPLPPGPVSLRLRGPDLAEVTTGPFHGGLDDLRLSMPAAVAAVWRGRVCRHPDGEGLADADVQLIDADGGVTATRSDEHGEFALPATAPARLEVHAAGHLRYAAVVTPQRDPIECRVWPAEPVARLAVRATALLQGCAVDARGQALRGVPVRFQPDAPGAPERPRLGDRPALPQLVLTDDDGGFAIETSNFGPGKLLLLHGGLAPMPLQLEARAGAVRDGLVLRARQ